MVVGLVVVTTTLGGPLEAPETRVLVVLQLEVVLWDPVVVVRPEAPDTEDWPLPLAPAIEPLGGVAAGLLTVRPELVEDCDETFPVGTDDPETEGSLGFGVLET